MPRQPDLFSSNPGGHTAVTHDHGSEGPVGSVQKQSTAGSRFGRALVAAEFLLAVMVRIFVGVIVLVLPWSPLWDNNHLLHMFPHIASFVSNGAIRGVISGIGLLNLWIAVDETLHRGERHN